MFQRTTRLAFVIGVMIAVAAAATLFDPNTASAEKTKVLMVHNGGHNFNGFKQTMDPVLDKTGDFEVAVAEGFDALKAETLKAFDVVLFYGSGGNINEEQEKGLDGFVTGGGGMVLVHATDASKKSEVYWRLNGGRFSGHGGGSFMVRIEETKHPITDGLEDFEITDETYRNTFHPEFKLNSLVHMDRGDEQQSMAWVLEPGKGRMFNTTLGHGQPAWANPQFQRLVVRGMYWAAGLEPKNP
jgi:type 1 glutamine amidotransferase